MANGIVEAITEKATQKGQKYHTLLIDGTWGSFWGDVDFAKGDSVEYEAQKKGQYTNYLNVRAAGTADASAGTQDRGRAGISRGDKETAITRMACTRTAAQLLTPFAPGKKETAQDRLATVFNVAAALEDYVYGRTPSIKTAPESLPEPTEKPDDSVFPSE
jgi:hypothetical protein